MKSTTKPLFVLLAFGMLIDVISTFLVLTLELGKESNNFIRYLWKINPFFIAFYFIVLFSLILLLYPLCKKIGIKAEFRAFLLIMGFNFFWSGVGNFVLFLN